MRKREPRNAVEEVTAPIVREPYGPIPLTEGERYRRRGMTTPGARIERPLPDVDEQEEEDEERVVPQTAEDAPDGPQEASAGDDTEGGPVIGSPAPPAGWGQSGAGDLDEVPALSTDHEYAAYTSGYRAGSDDPGWLLELAEMRRHLGSFFTEEEEEAFGAISPEDFWSRWGLGYADAVTNRTARRKQPIQADEMDW